MRNSQRNNIQKPSRLCVTAVLLLLMTLFAGLLTGCGKNTGAGTDGTESPGSNAEGGKGRFIESKVTLPEEISNIEKFRELPDGTLELFGYDADYSIYLAKSSDGGENWETKQLEDAAYNLVEIADDGTLAIIDYPENGVCPFTIVNPDGTSYSLSFAMPVEDSTVLVAAFDSNKQLIILDTVGSMYGINCTDGSITVTFEIDEDSYTPYFNVVGTNCFVVTKEKVLLFDTITGKEMGEQSALTDLF